MERKKIESGVQIGKLTVLSPTEERKNGYRIWLCGCACGNTISLDTRTLQRGTVRDCGCETKVKAGQRDVSGQRFGRLVALEPTAQRNKSGSTIWRCRCECGKETVVRYGNLISGHTKSCGCLQAGIAKETLKWIDGTSVTLLEARRARPISSNTSGYNGVYFSQSAQKWVAQITFKGETYYLGSYLRVEEAAQARKSAEERLYGEFLDWYYEMHS